MHYLRLIAFFFLDYRNLYGYLFHSHWDAIKGQMKKHLRVSAAIMVGLVCHYNAPTYSFELSLQDSYKATNKGGGLDCFLMGNNTHNLLYGGVQTHTGVAHTQIGVGTGYRRLIGARHTVGAYVFWDSLCDYQDEAISFSNINFGLEGSFHFLTFRFNGYTGYDAIKRERNEYNWIYNNRGNNLIKRGDCYVGEMIQKGWDGKVGITAFQDRATLFGGGYWFQGDVMAKPIQGMVGGVTIDITPRTRVHCQYTYDTLNKPTLSIGVQFNRGASSSLRMTGPLYRLWRPSERTLLPAGYSVKGDWFVREVGVWYCVDAKLADSSPAQKDNHGAFATVEHPAAKLSQALLDKIAQLSPNKSTIFLRPGTYNVSGGLKLHQGQFLEGDKREPVYAKEKYHLQSTLRLDKLFLSDNTSVKDLIISQNLTQGPSSIVEIADSKNVLFRGNHVIAKQFFSNEIIGIAIKNAHCIIDNNLVEITNTACFSEVMLQAIKAEGKQRLKINTRNFVELTTFSKLDTLIPMNVKELVNPIEYASKAANNSVQLNAPFLEDYLDDSFLDQIQRSGIESKGKTAHKQEEAVLNNVDLREAYKKHLVHHLKRDQVVATRLNCLEYYYRMPDEMKRADIEELRSIKKKIEAIVFCLREHMSAEQENVQSAYATFYNLISQTNIMSEPLTLEAFKQQSEEEMTLLYNKYTAYPKSELRPKDYDCLSDSDPVTDCFNSWKILSKFFNRKKIMDPLQSDLQQLNTYAKKYNVRESE